MGGFLISEMDDRAEILARAWGTGLEVIGFCRVENLTSAAYLSTAVRRLSGWESLTLHAPYCEIFPCAIDPLARGMALYRLRQAARVCQRLGVRRMIAHSGYAPMMYYPEWFVPKSIAFWREFARSLPPNLEVVMENVLDVAPEPMAEVCDGIGDARFGLCLDVGHANVYSGVTIQSWIAAWGKRIRHVHLHDNDGKRDQHAALGAGTLNPLATLEELRDVAPDADICIESVDAETSLKYLKKRSWI